MVGVTVIIVSAGSCVSNLLTIKDLVSGVLHVTILRGLGLVGGGRGTQTIAEEDIVSITLISLALIVVDTVDGHDGLGGIFLTSLATDGNGDALDVGSIKSVTGLTSTGQLSSLGTGGDSGSTVGWGLNTVTSTDVIAGVASLAV